MPYLFSDFELDPERRTLLLQDEALHTEPRVFDLLVDLVEHRDQVVSKDELIERVWGGAFVTDGALKRAVQEARRVLGDDGVRQELIQTVYGRGYRFVARTHHETRKELDEDRPVLRHRLLLALTSLSIVLVIAGSSQLSWQDVRSSEATPLSETNSTQDLPTKNLDAYHAYSRGLELVFERKDLSSIRLAIEMFERAIELDPDFVLAYCELSQTLSWMHFAGGAPPEALFRARWALDRATQIDPDEPMVRVASGFFYYHGLRDYPQALREFRKARQLLPDNAEVTQAIGSIYRRTGEYDLTIRNYLRALDLGPRDKTLLVHIGDTYWAHRDFGEADRYFEQFLSLVPDSAGVWSRRLYLSVAWRGTTAYARKLLKEIPREIQDELLLERVYLDLCEGKAAEAKALLGRRPIDLADFPGLRPGSLYLAEAELALDNPRNVAAAAEAQRAIFQNRLDQSSDTYFLHSFLGLAYAFLKDPERAIHHGVRGSEMETQDAFVGPVGTERLAVIYTRLGEHERAIELLENLVSRNYFTPLTHSRLRLEPWWRSLDGNPRFEALLHSGLDEKGAG